MALAARITALRATADIAAPLADCPETLAGRQADAGLTRSTWHSE
jgi:hypothetical protein